MTRALLAKEGLEQGYVSVCVCVCVSVCKRLYYSSVVTIKARYHDTLCLLVITQLFKITCELLLSIAIM